MKFFDSNCCLGKLSVPLPDSIETAEELNGLMERAGVDEALIHHALSKEYNPTVGNRKILAETDGHDNLHPCWTLLPHHTGEMPPAADLVEQMTAAGVRAARLFPKAHNWTLAEWCAGDLLRALEQAAIPLFLDCDQIDWNQVHSLAGEHPGLTFVLIGVPFRFSRQVYALLAETSNVYIETSLFQLHGGIEDVCARFGAARLLFGTAAPHFKMAPSVMAVRYTGISEKEKAMIAGGNLRKLLESAR
ncbi:MAG: amidohydrolase family protein [Planctomycetota bacterium]